MSWFGWFLWHTNYSKLFNATFTLYIYIKYIWLGWVGFYGISTIVGYLMINLFLYMYKTVLKVLTVLFQTIQFRISTQFKCIKLFYFKQFSSL